MQIEEKIAFTIRDQFPQLYREFGSELVDLVEEYYKFLEEETNQSVYNSRRLFEYRDISTTLSSLLLQFHKMFMADLPLKEDKDVRFIIKNVLDLYRRKGTPGGILLFFRMFYGQDVEIRYPASQMFKVSDSDWRKGVYLQCFPNDNEFSDSDGNKFTYADVIGKNIRGSLSEAKAAVDKINFVLLNGTLTPIVYISNVKGDFQKFDDLIASIGGREVAFGEVDGSPNKVAVDTSYGGATQNKVGDIYNIKSDEGGQGGKVIVTEIEDNETGLVLYTLEDGGYGYTTDGTRIKVSSQNLLLSNPDLEFVVGEEIADAGNNNIGIVTGQSAFAVGIYFEDENHEFSTDPLPQLFANDRAGRPRLAAGFDSTNTSNISDITEKNDSSPGKLFPDTANTNDVFVTVENEQTVSLITDKINIALTTPLNASDYNDTANPDFSGSADPVTISTRISDAFDLDPFEIGSIKSLVNINPGEDYTTDVWALAEDDTMTAFDRYEQVIVLTNVSAAMTKGDAISQANTGINANVTVEGIITDINSSEKFLKVRPYSYYGFESGAGDLVHKGNSYTVEYVARDYNADKLGESAEISAETIFESGRIAAVNIYESGLGYKNGETVFLTDDDGNIKARATLTATTQGITSGYWAAFNSHLNGYWTDPDTGNFEYYDAKKKIQDSDYYQEFSYEIKGTVGKREYEEPLKRTVHLAGTKMFGDFLHKRKKSFGILEQGMNHKFIQNIKFDTEVGGDPIVGPNQVVAGDGGGLTVDRQDYTTDSTSITADMISEP